MTSNYFIKSIADLTHKQAPATRPGVVPDQQRLRNLVREQGKLAVAKGLATDSLKETLGLRSELLSRRISRLSQTTKPDPV